MQTPEGQLWVLGHTPQLRVSTSLDMVTEGLAWRPAFVFSFRERFSELSATAGPSAVQER